MAIELAIDQLVTDPQLKKALQSRRLGLVANPASVTSRLQHSMDFVHHHFNLVCAFGPQHGMRGEKQYNMIETDDYTDPVTGVPVYSLYGEVRRPKDEWLNGIDTLLFDLQDLGCRIFTYVTTLRYVMEACHKKQVSLWVLDRPNPVGRPVEGMTRRPEWESFVGAAPIPMRYGLTIGELALWFAEHFQLDLDLKVIALKNYDPEIEPGYGWPLHEISWINPSPNAPNLNMARAYSGTVLLEGTHLNEGRGTTRPLELMGAPGLDIEKILACMENLEASWLKGCQIRPCFYEPTTYKNKGELCSGIQIHTDFKHYRHGEFKPFRLVCLFLKSLRQVHPHFDLYRKFDYEYETIRLAFDVICGGTEIREWIDDANSRTGDLEKFLQADEQTWESILNSHKIY